MIIEIAVALVALIPAYFIIWYYLNIPKYNSYYDYLWDCEQSQKTNNMTKPKHLYSSSE